jgi:hypothetical protein
MRKPPFQVTIRGVMFAVAVFATLVVVVQIGYRWNRFRENYFTNAADEQSWRKMMEKPVGIRHRSNMSDGEVLNYIESRKAARLRNIQYHVILKNKYKYAMWHPWISVPPDPEPPE